MQRSPTLLALALTASLLGRQAPQDPPTGQGPETPPNSQLEVLAARARELSKGLEGTWQLVRFRHATNDLGTTPIRGVVTFSADGFMHLLIHTVDPQPTVFSPEIFVQGGFHHWRVDSTGSLQTSTVLAHTNFDGDLESEPAYYPREYGLYLSPEGLSMTLTRADGSELDFEKLERSVFPEAAVENLRRLKAETGGVTGGR
jgi:hypothetical protein